MGETIDKLAIKLCENLPLNFTLYEKDGFCKRPNEYCNYCKKNGDEYLCSKKTYSLNKELSLA